MSRSGLEVSWVLMFEYLKDINVAKNIEGVRRDR